MSENQAGDAEEQLSKLNLKESSEDERLRPPSPNSDADSFHSAGEDEVDPDDSPQHR